MKEAKKNQKKQEELISILLAVYNPNLHWLKELLDSLNRQTYSNLELIICDDASEEERFRNMVEMVNQCMTNFPVRVLRNSENIGSNRTFLRLITEASGAYLAFCDQDDIWLENKIERLYQALKTEKAVLSYCDMQVIDKNGKLIGKSLKDIRKRLNYIKGEHLTSNYMFRNCTAGCSMLLDKNCALMAEVVPEGTYWDHWLCILASMQGKVTFVKERLVFYRIHGENQSGILAGIGSWENYYQERIMGLYRRVMLLHTRGYCYLGQQETEAMAEARKHRVIPVMWKYRYLCPREVYFEILFFWMPDWIFRLALLILRREDAKPDPKKREQKVESEVIEKGRNREWKE